MMKCHVCNDVRSNWATLTSPPHLQGIQLVQKHTHLCDDCYRRVIGFLAHPVTTESDEIRRLQGLLDDALVQIKEERQERAEFVAENKAVLP